MLMFPFSRSSVLIMLATHRHGIENQCPTSSLMRNLSQVTCLGLVVPWEIQPYLPAGGLKLYSSDVHAPGTASLPLQLCSMVPILECIGMGKIHFLYLSGNTNFLPGLTLPNLISSQTSFLIFTLLGQEQVKKSSSESTSN